MKARLLFNRDGTPFVGSAAEWAESCGLADRAVAKTYLARGRVLVSTVFLGLDHSLSPTGSPILFETMVFRSRAHVDMERYGTEREARLGHLRMVSRWQWRAWLEWVPWRAIREFWRRLMDAIPARRTRCT